MNPIATPCVVSTVLFLCGCTHNVTVEPVELKPIHLTMDLNIKVQRELDDFFDFEEAAPTEPAEEDSSAVDPESEGGQ